MTLAPNTLIKFTDYCEATGEYDNALVDITGFVVGPSSGTYGDYLVEIHRAEAIEIWGESAIEDFEVCTPGFVAFEANLDTEFIALG